MLVSSRVRLAGPVDEIMAAHPRMLSLEDLVLTYLEGAGPGAGPAPRDADGVR